MGQQPSAPGRSQHVADTSGLASMLGASVPNINSSSQYNPNQLGGPTTPTTTSPNTPYNNNTGGNNPTPIVVAPPPTDPLLISLNDLAQILAQFNEDPLINLLDEISRHYRELQFGNLKKYLNVPKYASDWLEGGGDRGGGGLFGGGSFGGSGLDDEDDLGVSYNTNSAYTVWLTALKDRQIPRFIKKLEKFKDHSGRKPNISFNVQMSTSSTQNSLRRASSFVGAQANQRPSYVVDMDSKQRYYEVRNEMVIILTHVLEEIKDLRECIEQKRKSEATLGANSTISDSINVAPLFNEFDFEKQWWEQKIGLQNFSVRKKGFIDAVEETFAHLKTKWDIDLLEEISDPTCDGVVSVTDLKNVVRWFGSIFRWQSDELKLRSIAAKEEYAPLNFLPHFWGSLTGMDAQDLLRNEEPGTYLIRFNECEPGTLCLSSVQEEVGSTEENGHGFFSSRQVYHFVLRRTKTDKEGACYYLCDADKAGKFKTITELVDKCYFLTFKYPYVNDELKSASITKKREVDVLSALRFYSSEHDDSTPYPFVIYKGKFTTAKKDSDVNKQKTLSISSKSKALDRNSSSGNLNSSTNSLPSLTRAEGSSSSIPRVETGKEEIIDLGDE
ncbi:hypothetical protein C9374_003621 [Naegleria lovaniensis]|uniref:SH2 domain-containing protein n=1 Tax=Naegleria lovaniensis TaxID=51637 RepID=A0AA88H7Q7_NAELO|nr:uncharacterized protein C9374_003621 [Naegleria lovaniensis]KAG2393857.1 hypothetical protein C9374_003621 [Naegleria lovaniensis]